MSNIRFTISRKISIAFGVFILSVATVFVLTYDTLSEARKTNILINEVYSPSLQAVEHLENLMTRSLVLIRYWTFVQSRADDLQKQELKELIEKELPAQMSLIEQLSGKWTADERESKKILFSNIRQILLVYEENMRLLPNFESYSDPLPSITAEHHFLQGEPISNGFINITKELTRLSANQQAHVSEATKVMNKSFDELTRRGLYLGIFVLIIGIVIAVFLIGSITGPVNRLKKTLLYLGKGIYPKKTIPVSNDEIGDMGFAVNKLIQGLKKTKEFSLEVGGGNFDAVYNPLSDDDELGKALLVMRDDLAANERMLEKKVEERTNEVVEQKEKVERQKERVTQLYTDLTDSINYARRIQQTILPTDEYVHTLFPESFVLYRPKDIVSGDFYWFKMAGKKKMFAALDCTGHGVPGAFMSLVGHNVLNQITKAFTQPSSILNGLNRLSAEVLRAGQENRQLHDGMDLALCVVDTETLELEYAGAYNPVYIVRDGILSEHRADKYTIGSFEHGTRTYTNHKYQLEKGDCIYIFSDGYADQFGGPKGKKFMKKRFRELLIEISPMKMIDQERRLKKELIHWQGAEEQVDDILVIGVRV